MKKRNSLLIGVFAALVLGQAILHRAAVWPQWKRDYAPKNMTGAVGLSPDQMLFALAGFREMIAGILWVRGDSFFETGNYDAVLPIIRLVTILDPSQIDVYGTGMWHIAYNFTDEEQRSDRRYIPPAIALGKEGAAHNKHTYELFYDLAWLWHHKVEDDFPQAVSWFQEAMEREDVPPARRSLLRNALERDNRPLEALDHLYDLEDMARKRFERERLFQARQHLETTTNNIDTTLIRLVQRGTIAKMNGWYDQGDYDTKPPFDVNFSAKVTVLEPKVLRIEGTWNVLPVGTRIRVVLRDQDLPGGIPAGMDWDKLATGVNLEPQREVTFMQDQLYVRNRRFNKRIDMSKDPTMYPFTKDKYVIEFYYNPRMAPAHIQDKFGWNGEGMTDKNFLRRDIRPGQPVVYASLELSKDQILRLGDWQDRTPILKTKNYKQVETGDKEDQIIMVPSLRSGAGS